MIAPDAWEVIRCLFFCVCYTVLPGLVVTYFMTRKQKLRVSEYIGWAVGWSIVVNILVAYPVKLVHGSLDNYVAVMMGFDVVGVGFILTQISPSKLKAVRLHIRDLVFPGLVLLIGLCWFGIILQIGPRFDYGWDHWFHIAHVRQAVESNSIVPGNPYWSDEPLSDMYGSWHSLLAAVTRSARISVLDLWRIGNAYMAALGFILMYSVAGAFLSKPVTRMVAAIVFLGSGFGALEITRSFIFPWGITNLLLWITLGMLFQYLMHGDRRRALSATAIGLAPAFIHPQEYILLCFGVFVLGVSAVLTNRASSRNQVDIRRVWLFLALIILLGLPVLVLKYPNRVSIDSNGATAAVSPSLELTLYQQPLAKLLARSFPYFWKFGRLMLSLLPSNLISLLIVFLLPKYLNNRIRWFLITLTWAPTLAAVFPGLSWLTQLVLKETYSWRLLNLIPTPFIWAPIIVEGISTKILGKTPGDEAETRFARRLSWEYFAVVVVLIGSVGLSVSATVRRDELGPTRLTPLHSQAMFGQLDQFTSEPAVVLSDPETSYAIPGLTKHYVVLNEPSHGSREDIITRFTDTRELLSSPYQSTQAAVATLERYSVGFIVVNKPWLDKVFFLGTPFYSDYTLSFLNMNPLCFQPLSNDATFAVFKVMACEPDDFAGKGLINRSSISAGDVEHVIHQEFTSDFSLLGYSLSGEDGIQTGQSLTVDLYWQATDSIKEPFVIWIELLRDYPGRSLPYGKALRRANEILTGNAFWIDSAAWLPIPPAGLSSQTLLQQTFTLQIPPNVVEGSYDLSMYVLGRRQALYDQAALPYLLMERENTLPGVRLGSVNVRN